MIGDRAGECDGEQSAGGDAAVDGQRTPSMRVREGQQKFLRQTFPERQPNLPFWGTWIRATRIPTGRRRLRKGAAASNLRTYQSRLLETIMKMST